MPINPVPFLTKPENLLNTSQNKPDKNINEAIQLKTSDKITLNGISNASHFIDFVNPEEEQNALPPIEEKVEPLSNGKFLKISTNAYGVTINVMNTKPDRLTYQTLSSDGLSLILSNNNKGERDTLCFSEMGDNVPKNSMIPNTYYLVTGKSKESKMYFNKNHDIVVELRTGEKLVIDGKDGNTVKEGNFDIKLSQNHDGKGFIVKYTGNNSANMKKKTSFGDNVAW